MQSTFSFAVSPTRRCVHTAYRKDSSVFNRILGINTLKCNFSANTSWFPAFPVSNILRIEIPTYQLYCGVFCTTANMRTSQRTVYLMQRFAVSQKNRTEAITISSFSLSLLYSAKNREFSTLRCKNRQRPTEIECRLFCCPILLSRCRFCSFLKLLSYRHTANARPFLIL